MKELSTVEVIHLIQELKRMEKADDPKSWKENIFNQIPGAFKVTICLGCRQPLIRDCGCSAGSSERLVSGDSITGLLQSGVNKW